MKKDNAAFSGFCCLLVIFFMTSNKQLYGKRPNRNREALNGIMISGATLKFTGMYALNFERAIYETKQYRISVATGLGGWYFDIPGQYHSGYSWPVSLHSMIGRHAQHFEVSFGLRYTWYQQKTEATMSPFFPVFDIGYRYQRQDGKGLIFRSFVGLSGVGIGIGKAF